MSDTNAMGLQVIDESQSAALLRLAIDKNIDLDKLERLIDLKNAEESRLAKQAFDENFARMQAEYVPVKKGKEVKNGPKTVYSYAALEDILKVYQPIISKHGFSYRWKEESILDGREKRIHCIVSGWGHSESVYSDIPISEGGGFTNAAQQRGSSSSYGKRYSFCAAFGVIIEDEDDDGQALTFDNAMKFPYITDSLRTATKETLALEFQKIMGDNKDNEEAREYAKQLKDLRKKELFGGAKN